MIKEDKSNHLRSEDKKERRLRLDNHEIELDEVISLTDGNINDLLHHLDTRDFHGAIIDYQVLPRDVFLRQVTTALVRQENRRHITIVNTAPNRPEVHWVAVTWQPALRLMRIVDSLSASNNLCGILAEEARKAGYFVLVTFLNAQRGPSCGYWAVHISLFMATRVFD